MSYAETEEKRIIAEAQYLIDNKSTVRATAKQFGVSKSTVHKDISQKLKQIDYILYTNCMMVFNKNIEERSDRGGEATKLKYEKQDKLITDNLKFVYYIVHKYFSNCGIEYDDLFQVGCIGLIKAANNFDESKKIKFTSFAATCITNEIRMLLRKNKNHISEISIDAEIKNGDDDNSKITFEDQLPDKVDIEEEIISKSELNNIKNFISFLPDREQEIIKARIQGERQDKIKDKLNLSQSYISRIIKRIGTKYKNYKESDSTMVGYDELYKLAKQYGTDKEGKTKIAAVLNSTVNSVSFYLSSLGVNRELKKEKEGNMEKASEVSAPTAKKETDIQKPIEKSIENNSTTDEKTEKDLKINTNENIGLIKPLITSTANINVSRKSEKQVETVHEYKEPAIIPTEISLKGKLMNWRVYDSKVSFKRPSNKSSMVLNKGEIDELINELCEIKHSYIDKFKASDRA